MVFFPPHLSFSPHNTEVQQGEWGNAPPGTLSREDHATPPTLSNRRAVRARARVALWKRRERVNPQMPFAHCFFFSCHMSRGETADGLTGAGDKQADLLQALRSSKFCEKGRVFDGCIFFSLFKFSHPTPRPKHKVDARPPRGVTRANTPESATPHLISHAPGPAVGVEYCKRRVVVEVAPLAFRFIKKKKEEREKATTKKNPHQVAKPRQDKEPLTPPPTT